MRITQTTFGGLAATFTGGLPPTVVDTDSLQSAAAAEIAAAVRSALAEESTRPAADTTRRRPDAATYRVQVTDDAGDTHELTRSDGADAPAFWTLLDLVRNAAG